MCKRMQAPTRVTAVVCDGGDGVVGPGGVVGGHQLFKVDQLPV